jgi:hypothetical protein
MSCDKRDGPSARPEAKCSISAYTAAATPAAGIRHYCIRGSLTKTFESIAENAGFSSLGGRCSLRPWVNPASGRLEEV